jgi:hypothetical protein
MRNMAKKMTVFVALVLVGMLILQHTGADALVIADYSISMRQHVLPVPALATLLVKSTSLSGYECSAIGIGSSSTVFCVGSLATIEYVGEVYLGPDNGRFALPALSSDSINIWAEENLSEYTDSHLTQALVLEDGSTPATYGLPDGFDMRLGIEPMEAWATLTSYKTSGLSDSDATKAGSPGNRAAPTLANTCVYWDTSGDSIANHILSTVGSPDYEDRFTATASTPAYIALEMWSVHASESPADRHANGNLDSNTDSYSDGVAYFGYDFMERHISEAWWEIDGSDNFANGGQSFGSNYSTDVTQWQLNGDGVGDFDTLVKSYFESNKVWVWRDNGTPSVAMLIDANAKGNPELYSIEWWWENDGSDYDFPRGRGFDSDYSTDVTQWQLNGDGVGDFDALVKSYFGSNKVWDRWQYSTPSVIMLIDADFHENARLNSIEWWWAYDYLGQDGYIEVGDCDIRDRVTDTNRWYTAKYDYDVLDRLIEVINPDGNPNTSRRHYTDMYSSGVVDSYGLGLQSLEKESSTATSNLTIAYGAASMKHHATRIDNADKEIASYASSLTKHCFAAMTTEYNIGTHLFP